MENSPVFDELTELVYGIMPQVLEEDFKNVTIKPKLSKNEIKSVCKAIWLVNLAIKKVQDVAT